MKVDKDYLKSIIKQTKDYTILYAEDNEEQRLQTIKMLQNYFGNIISAVNGHEAFELYKEHKDEIKIVFTDIKMPIMDGIKLCEHIRETDKIVPVVIFSAYDDKEFLLEGIKVGIDGYILKPYTLELITETIQKIIKKTGQFNIRYLKDGFYWNQNDESLYNKDHHEIKLSKNERVLVKLLSSAENKIVSPLDIENEVFDDLKSDNRRVRNLISRLNLKLNKNLVESIYGEGYKIALNQ